MEKKIRLHMILGIGVFLLLCLGSSLRVDAKTYKPGEIYGDCPKCVNKPPAGSAGPVYNSVKVQDVIQNPDCTTAGRLNVSCDYLCGYYVDVFPPALGHDYQNPVTTNPTCTANGTETTTCSRCNDTSTKSIPATGHSFRTSTTEATCTESGREVSTCSGCGLTQESKTAALGHLHQLVNEILPTCTSTGQRVFTCGRCGDTYREETAALGHDYRIAVNTEPTCTAAGQEVQKCTRCGDTKTTEKEALGHDLRTTVTKEASCKEEGTQITTCSRCDYRTTKKIAALEHDYKETEKEATCTTPGEIIKKCKKCGDEKKETKEALGHKYSEFVIVKEPTCDEDGLQKATCERCGDTLEEAIPKTGHTYPDKWTVVKTAGWFHDGTETMTCPDCSTSITQKIPKKGVPPMAAAGGGGAVLLAGAVGWLWWKRKGLFADPEPLDAEPLDEEPLEEEAVTAEVVTPEEPEMKMAGGFGAVEAVVAASGTVAGAAKAARGLHKLPLETKAVVVRSENEALTELLRNKRFIQDTPCTWEALRTTVTEKEPDFVLCSIDTKEQLDEIVALKKGDLEKYAFGLVVDQTLLETNEAELKKLEEDGTIESYLSSTFSPEAVLTKLVAPVLKPSPKSDLALESIGMVAEALGIPGISGVIEAFTAGRELKETVQKNKLEAMDQATIISDIANILGFGMASDVLELITEVDALKKRPKDLTEEPEDEAGNTTENV